MRIGIDARFFGPSGKGLGRYVQKLITNLERIDQDDEYVIFLRRDNWEAYHPSNKRFTKVLADYRWYTLTEQLGMPRAINRQRVDVMHFPHFNVPLLYRGKFIVTIHDLILTKYPTTRATTLGPLKYAIKHAGYSMVIKHAIHHATRIIAVSEFTKNDITAHFSVSGDKIVVTHEATDPARQLTDPVGQRLDTYHVAAPFLLYVGNVYPHKNIEGLLRAFKIILSKKPDIALVLVGKSDYFFERVHHLAQELGITKQVIFPGFVPDDDLPYFYAGASAYVFPSFYEGFGLPALEACSYGTPVIASNSSCLQEILAQAAVYFNPHDCQDMAQKVYAVLSNPALAADLRQHGFERVKYFGWEVMAQQTLDLYRKM